MTLLPNAKNIQAVWGDFGFKVIAFRPTENEQEDESSILADSVTLQPIFGEKVGESMDFIEAMEIAQEAARKPRYLWVVVAIRVAPPFLNIGDVAILKDGNLTLQLPRRTQEHLDRRPTLALLPVQNI